MPRADDQAKKKDLRRRREILVILSLLFIIALLFFFQTHISTWKVEIPFPNNVLIISLIGLNILLVLLVIFLILRNVVKLLFERRKRVLGAKLRIKLIFSFIALSLAPTVILFFIATYFITSSIENLFSGQVEKSLQESLEVAQIYYKNTSNSNLYFGRQIRQEMVQHQLLEKRNPAFVQEFLKAKRGEYNLEAVEVISETSSHCQIVTSPSSNEDNATDTKTGAPEAETCEEATSPSSNEENATDTKTGAPEAETCEEVTSPSNEILPLVPVDDDAGTQTMPSKRRKYTMRRKRDCAPSVPTQGILTSKPVVVCRQAAEFLI